MSLALEQLPAPQRLLLLMEEYQRRKNGRLIDTLYPETGPFRRALYPKHQAFLAAGAIHRVRSAIAANRVGKTKGMGGYELTLHLTGLYPAWWTGKRFNKPVRAWAAGNTGKSTKEILQDALLGPKTLPGTGLIPDKAIDWGSRRSKQGVADGVESIAVKHVTGGWSTVVFKSYDQGREAFEGTEQEVILLDEEPPLDVFSECLVRTMTTGGAVMLTFTPLSGLTPLIKHLRETGAFEIGVTWDDVPHLSESDKAEILKNTPPHMRDARSKGVPMLGSGAVFPVPESMIVVEPFRIPEEFRLIGGLDFGWDHPQAGVLLAYDADNDVIYVTREDAARETTPAQFVPRLRSWGSRDPAKPAGDQWLPWAWPHDGLQHDKKSGEELAKEYRAQGLLLTSKHATWVTGGFGFEAGILDMLTRMQEGRWKVFSTCSGWLEEFRNYHRDEGEVVKIMDDRISASRVARMMIREAVVRPPIRKLVAIGAGRSTVGDASIGY